MVERSICIREVKGSMPFFSTRVHFAPVRTSALNMSNKSIISPLFMTSGDPFAFVSNKFFKIA